MHVIAYWFLAFINLCGLSNGAGEICAGEHHFVLSDNLITLSMILKATSEDFTLGW